MATTIDFTSVDVTDDTGGGTDGTVWNAAWVNSLESTINALPTDGNLGSVFINESSNPNMTNGITVQMGNADNQAVCLKSTDVATGMSTLPLSNFDVQTDDFYAIGKVSVGAGGGIHIVSVEEVVGGGSGCRYEHWGGVPSTDDNSASIGAMSWSVGRHDTANAALDMAADSNAFSWHEITSAPARACRMLLKADDGELHLGNTTLVALDEHDDVGLVRAMQFETSGGAGMAPTPWDTSDYGVPAFSYEKLRAVGVLGERDETGGCLMRVQPRFAMNEGAIWQNYCRIRSLELKLEQRWINRARSLWSRLTTGAGAMLISRLAWPRRRRDRSSTP